MDAPIVQEDIIPPEDVLRSARGYDDTMEYNGYCFELSKQSFGARFFEGYGYRIKVYRNTFEIINFFDGGKYCVHFYEDKMVASHRNQEHCALEDIVSYNVVYAANHPYRSLLWLGYDGEIQKAWLGAIDEALLSTPRGYYGRIIMMK